MEVKKSIMELIGFNVLESDVKLILPENNDKTFNPDVYQIDIEFDIKSADNNGEHLIVMELVVNQEKSVGYYAKLLCATHLKFSDKISDEEKQQMLFFSGVGMSITNARSFLTNVTSYNVFFPQYILPSVDMNQLIEDKIGAQNDQTLSKIAPQEQT